LNAVEVVDDSDLFLGEQPARKAGLAAMPTRVIKTGASRSVVGGVARSARTAGVRRLRGV
jgi:hypothetical protein